MIREIVKKYGFYLLIDDKKIINGEDLYLVKNNRNDLVYGSKFFIEVGKEKGVDELIKIKN